MPEEKPHYDTSARRTFNQDFEGTLYPYTNYAPSTMDNILAPFRRILYPINPFASQQVPTNDSLGKLTFFCIKILCSILS